MKWLQDFLHRLFQVSGTSPRLKRAFTLVDKASEDDLKKIIISVEEKIKMQG